MTIFERAHELLHREDEEMKKGAMVPPEHCVLVEMENKTYLGYRAARLLAEIERYGSLTRSAQWAGVETGHARELLLDINSRFSQPLISFAGDPRNSDSVSLTEKGDAITRYYWNRYTAALPPFEERQARGW